MLLDLSKQEGRYHECIKNYIAEQCALPTPGVIRRQRMQGLEWYQYILRKSVSFHVPLPLQNCLRTTIYAQCFPVFVMKFLQHGTRCMPFIPP